MDTTMRQEQFEKAFLGDSRQLPSVLVNVIENLNLEQTVERPPFRWGKNTLDSFYDEENPGVPGEASFLAFCDLPQVISVMTSDVSKLLAFRDEWLAANPPETTIVHPAEEQAVAEAAEEVLPEAAPEPETSSVVASSIDEAAEVSVEKPADVVANVTWAPDGTSVTIGGQVIDLTSSNKPVRTAMFARLNVLKKDKPWRELTASGDSNQSIYGMKVGSTPVTRHRVEHWVRVLKVDIPTLFGIKLDAVRAEATIPVEKSQVEKSTVVEVPDTTEAEAATTVAALETTEAPAHVEESTTADAQTSTETAAVVAASGMTEASATPEAPAIVEVDAPIEASAPVEVSAPPTVMAESEGEVSEQEKSRQYLLGIRHGMDNLSGEVMDLLGDAALSLQSPDFRALVVAEIMYTELKDPLPSLLLKVLEAESDRYASMTFGEFFTALRSKQ